MGFFAKQVKLQLMTPWLYEGVFWFELADGWKATEIDNLVEVVPPEPAGALHISVLRRTKLAPLNMDEAVQLVVNFAEKQGRPLKASGVDAHDHVVAGASFTATTSTGRYKRECGSVEPLLAPTATKVPARTCAKPPKG